MQGQGHAGQFDQGMVLDMALSQKSARATA
jgi:hypothetical protein